MKWIFFLLLPLLTMASCNTSMDDYKEFTKGGEIVYSGRIDSVKVLPGNNRVIITGLFMSDPKVSLCRIFWNGGLDSLEVPINKTANVDTLKQEIVLPENIYNFEIYTYDKSGNKSVAVYATGKTYGQRYIKSLNNRLISAAIFNDNDGTTKIFWRSIDRTLGALATEVTYTSTSGAIKTKQFSVLDKESVLADLKEGTTFDYNTIYLPDTLCVDTFKTEIVNQRIGYRLDKTTWTVPQFSSEEDTEQLNNHNSGPANRIIDGDPESYWHSHHGHGDMPGYPHWLVVDMQEVKNVINVELLPRLRNTFGPRKVTFECSKDGTTWTSYGTFDFPQNSTAQTFSLSGVPIARYIKLTFPEGHDFYAHLGELSVIGF